MTEQVNGKTIQLVAGKGSSVDPNCVRFCKELLEKAMSGEIQWIALVAQTEQGFDTAWNESGSRPINGIGAMGAIAVLQQEFYGEVVCRQGG